ncbi:GntR family transcriptional regulator [Rhizorhabdus argentea]|uniref:GntR family transcriptional regulator n=1 Tax=Rhizorhabdus argentea TaxID=1387174 RepID=UPI0030ECCCA5
MMSSEPLPDDDNWHGAEPAGSARRVYLGILQDLESGRMVPGQRLAETDLSARFAVGRNAVREAMQHLAARGVVDLSRNRSPAIRQLDLTESLEVLDVAEAMTRLAARAAATRYQPRHATQLQAAIDDLVGAAADEPPVFSGARRSFYRTLLLIGGNRELQRLFPAIGVHIIHAQFPSARLRGIRIADYRAIAAAVAAGDAATAEDAATAHVDAVRAVVRELAAGRR